MKIAEVVDHLCMRPGMWVVGPPYVPAVFTFLNGYDFARDGGPLAGLREWLIVRSNGGNNLAWEGLAWNILLPGTGMTAPLTAEQEATCLRGLASLLQEFLRDREEGGITKVHHDYARWLLKKRWYSGPLRKKPKDSG